MEYYDTQALGIFLLKNPIIKQDLLYDEYGKEDPLSLEMKDLGSGGIFMNYLVSSGTDSFIISRNGELIAGMAHLYAYDFKLLYEILLRNGFSDIRERNFCESEIDELTEPLHPVGEPPIWVNESEWKRPQGVTGFDRDPAHLLIVEARKNQKVCNLTKNRVELLLLSRNISFIPFLYTFLTIIIAKLSLFPVNILKKYM